MKQLYFKLYIYFNEKILEKATIYIILILNIYSKNNYKNNTFLAAQIIKKDK